MAPGLPETIKWHILALLHAKLSVKEIARVHDTTETPIYQSRKHLKVKRQKGQGTKVTKAIKYVGE